MVKDGGHQVFLTRPTSIHQRVVLAPEYRLCLMSHPNMRAWTHGTLCLVGFNFYLLHTVIIQEVTKHMSSEKMEDLFCSNGTTPTPEVMSNWEANLLSSDQNFSSLPTFWKLRFFKFFKDQTCSVIWCYFSSPLRPSLESQSRKFHNLVRSSFPPTQSKKPSNLPQSSLSLRQPRWPPLLLFVWDLWQLWWDSNLHSLTLVPSFVCHLKDKHCSNKVASACEEATARSRLNHNLL